MRWTQYWLLWKRAKAITGIPEIYRLRGELRLARDGDTAQAEADFRLAIDVARRQQARFWELRATMSLARSVAAARQAGRGPRGACRDLHLVRRRFRYAGPARCAPVAGRAVKETCSSQQTRFLAECPIHHYCRGRLPFSPRLKLGWGRERTSPLQGKSCTYPRRQIAYLPPLISGEGRGGGFSRRRHRRPRVIPFVQSRLTAPQVVPASSESTYAQTVAGLVYGGTLLYGAE